MSVALAFLDSGRPLDYGARLSRLRWRRAAGASGEAVWRPEAFASEALAGAEAWLVVLDPAAIPAFREAPQAVPGRLLGVSEALPPAVHTLRELEASALGDGASPAAGKPAAIVFRSADFEATGGETVKTLIERLLTGPLAPADGLRAVRLEESSARERPELTRRLPEGAVRILDVGCGAGATLAAARSRRPRWTVVGIEADPALAARARSRCDRVIEGDLRRALPELARLGERFDAVVFADVLEHLEDPIAALAAARAVAAEGGRVLVSVPNVGHLSVVRDLAAGRFDPIPAGLTDARHLRWFTRAFLADALEEAGWKVVAIESEPGAPAPDAAAFLAATGGWSGSDVESLATYQWIAEAVAGGR